MLGMHALQNKNRGKVVSALDKDYINLEILIRKLKTSKKIILICGPTGVGKSKLGITISDLLNTDLISMDSMQVYRGMDIGTDKLNTNSKKINQFMVNIFDPDHKLTVMEFRNIAVEIINREFFNNEKIPVLVGGSGLYIKAVIDGLDKGPGEDSDFRKEIKKNIEKYGPDKYYNILLKIDRPYALRIERNDIRRIIRALEVYNQSGLTFSEMQRSWKGKNSFNSVLIGLKKERKSLYRDIEKRVDDMFKKGLVKEVNKLINDGYGDSLSLKQAVGYKEVIEYLKGNINLEECRELIKKNTRRLAKKQLTWFRGDKRINWLSADKYDNIIDLAIETIKIINNESDYEKI
jgi:tRNA dimethylallyltransferase